MASSVSEVMIIDEASEPVTIHYQSFFDVDGSEDVIMGFRTDKDKIDLTGLFASLGDGMDRHNLRFIRRDGNLIIMVNDDEYGYGENEYVVCTLYDCPLSTRDVMSKGFIIF